MHAQPAKTFKIYGNVIYYEKKLITPNLVFFYFLTVITNLLKRS